MLPRNVWDLLEDSESGPDPAYVPAGVMEYCNGIWWAYLSMCLVSMAFHGTNPHTDPLWGSHVASNLEIVVGGLVAACFMQFWIVVGPLLRWKTWKTWIPAGLAHAVLLLSLLFPDAFLACLRLFR